MADQNKVMQWVRDLFKHTPQPGEEHFGVYIPDNAAQGTFYLGVGKVIETGITPSGGTYVWVEPYARRNPSIFDGSYECNKGKRAAYYRFFHPESDEEMPAEYLPPYRLNQDELDLAGPGRAGRLPKLHHLPSRGEEARGLYIAPDTQLYEGVGRVLQGHAKGRGFFAWVEPIPGRNDDAYRFFDRNNDSDMHYINMPCYGAHDAAMQELLANPRPKKDSAQPRGRNSASAARHDTFPKLGSEAMGTYFAPDGRFYIGVGKVTAIGLNHCGAIYALVKPVPGKSGGDYDFYDELTLEHMPDFTGHASSKSRFPWRDHFSKTVEELAPKFKGSGLRALLPF
ncbi:hypothetical protein ASPCAL05128 [Aspergillus calidoustus]|uniref:Uncharacterized protein n=1 Tax=Aspergillus calidoustus TaxID=454130 RepID=A0A0U5C6H0_ASPCI|nr:hypothetical protein ASPCAL05128 [Aspergillus calidoustus]